ncbi:MAG: SDR family oxidoreductase [Lactobacillales bacterium]|jgi:nucleoside-diphosphate-sugar epimerase|nr:SDR family oxidoreductase [Lactobacillales bacterium]
MKALFIGGTGNISGAVVERAIEKGWDVTLLNRGNKPLPAGVGSIIADINNEASVAAAIKDLHFDVVAQFIAFVPADVERDIRLFKGHTDQYIFISTASAYQKPPVNLIITESTPLINPFWDYSSLKADCERVLLDEPDFPVTIVRPSHTYSEKPLVCVQGEKGPWQVVKRMLENKPVILPGDGTSSWTMTHASDFAKGFVALMGNPHAAQQAYHITTDETMSWNQIYQTIARAAGVEVKIVHITSDDLAVLGEHYNYRGQMFGDKAVPVLFDNSKIKAVASEFVCTTTMAEGLTKATLNFLASPELQVEDPEFDAWCDEIIALKKF